MKQNIVIIGDTHFGVRNNSMTWLKHQKAGFEEIIQYVEQSMEKFDETVVIHVGDLFDSRSAINPLIYKSVETLLRYMNDALTPAHNHEFNKGRMYIIGGNHDYYYQWESENNYSSTLMLPKLNNIDFINTTNGSYDDLLMIPWFMFHNPDKLNKVLRLQRVHMQGKPFMIFTHTDPFHMDPEVIKLIKGIPLITGHIHQPTFDWEHHLLVTGASYPIDFTDTNSKRGFWNMVRTFDYSYDAEGKPIKTYNDDIKIGFHPIKSSIQFHTITEHALPDWESIGIKKDDYVEIQIRANHVDDYKDILKKLNEDFNTNVMYLTEATDIITDHTEVLNVDTVFKKLLPKKLEGVYERMVKECSNQSA